MERPFEGRQYGKDELPHLAGTGPPPEPSSTPLGGGLTQLAAAQSLCVRAPPVTVITALPQTLLWVSNPILHTTDRWVSVPGNRVLHKTAQFQGAVKTGFPTSECN